MDLDGGMFYGGRILAQRLTAPGGGVVTLGLDFPATLAAARIGVDWAWTRLYRELAPSVLRYFRAYKVDDSEDLLGEVFLQVVRNLPSFAGGEDEFRAWVFTIARRRLVDEWRRKARHPEKPCADEDLFAAAEVEDGEDHALRSLADAHVRAIMACLTVDQRDVLFLRIIAGLSIEQTAEVLGKTPGSVKAVHLRGLQAIRRHLVPEVVAL
jgi:RNA polymerase sigma factor (sigma-70 family)